MQSPQLGNELERYRYTLGEKQTMIVQIHFLLRKLFWILTHFAHAGLWP